MPQILLFTKWLKGWRLIYFGVAFDKGVTRLLINFKYIVKVVYVKNTRVADEVITRDKTEYYSHSLAEFMDGKNRNKWVLITRFSTGE